MGEGCLATYHIRARRGRFTPGDFIPEWRAISFRNRGRFRAASAGSPRAVKRNRRFGGLRVKKRAVVTIGSSAPIDRPCISEGERTTFEDPCPPKAKVTRSNRVGFAS